MMVSKVMIVPTIITYTITYTITTYLTYHRYIPNLYHNYLACHHYLIYYLYSLPTIITMLIPTTIRNG